MPILGILVRYILVGLKSSSVILGCLLPRGRLIMYVYHSSAYFVSCACAEVNDLQVCNLY